MGSASEVRVGYVRAMSFQKLDGVDLALIRQALKLGHLPATRHPLAEEILVFEADMQSFKDGKFQRWRGKKPLVFVVLHLERVENECREM